MLAGAGVLAYALFLAALAIFPDGRAQLLRASSIVRKIAKR
jgi:polysaccharide transporter, PST family